MVFSVEIACWPSEIGIADEYTYLKRLLEELIIKSSSKKQFVIDTQNSSNNEVFKILNIFDKQKNMMYKTIKEKYPEHSIKLVYYVDFYSSQSAPYNSYNTDSRLELENYLIAIFDALKAKKISFNSETNNRCTIDIDVLYEISNKDKHEFIPTILNFKIVIRPIELFW